MQSNLHCIQSTHPFLLSLGIEPITLSLLAPFFTDWATGIESLVICSCDSVVRVFIDVERKCNLLLSCAGNAFVFVCHMSVTWRQVRQQSKEVTWLYKLFFVSFHLRVGYFKRTRELNAHFVHTEQVLE